jgi:hypothetical protein
VLVRQQAAHLLVVQKLGQEPVCNLRLQQPLAVLRRLVDVEPDQRYGRL